MSRPVMRVGDFHAGHIISVKNGGKRDIKNGIAICNKCNSNDCRNIPDMMNQD